MINMEFRTTLISGRRQKEFNLLVKFYLLNWVGTWFFFILVFILSAQAKNCPFFESLRQCLYTGGITKLGSYSPVSSLGSLWKQRPRQGHTQGACFGKWPHVTRWEQGRRESPSSFCPGVLPSWSPLSNWGLILLGALWGTRIQGSGGWRVEEKGRIHWLQPPTGLGLPCEMLINSLTLQRLHLHQYGQASVHSQQRNTGTKSKISTVPRRPAAVGLHLHTGEYAHNSWSENVGRKHAKWGKKGAHTYVVHIHMYILYIYYICIKALYKEW